MTALPNRLQRSSSARSTSSTTSKLTRDFVTTIETVALTHHSFVALAQLSDRCVAKRAGELAIVGVCRESNGFRA